MKTKAEKYDEKSMEYLKEFGFTYEQPKQHKPYNALDYRYGCYIKNNEYLRRDLKQEILDEGERYLAENDGFIR